MTLEFANNANSTLNSGISSGATSFTVVSGGGAKFPAIGSGPNSFYVTITDAATETLSEIFLCTARSGDVFTVTGAQQGTTAQSWNTGDIVAQLITAGDMSAFIQSSNVLANPSAQVGLTAVNGTATTGMRSDAAPSLNQGISPTWTGTHTFNGTVDLNGPVNVTNSNAMTFGSINQIVVETSTYNYLLAAGNSGTGIQTINPPSYSGQVLTYTSGSTQIQWSDAPIAANNVLLYDGYNAVWGDIPGFSSQSLTNPGYQKLPGGLILQWGTETGYTTSSSTGSVTFPIAFPTACLNVTATGWGYGDAAGQASATINGVSIYASGGTASTTGFSWIMQNLSNLNGFNWFAIGH